MTAAAAGIAVQAGDIHALRDFVAELGWAIPDSVATLGFDPLILDTAFEAVVDVRAMDLETVDTETALIKYGVAATAAGALAAHIASVADDLDTHLGNTFLNAAADMVTEFPKRLVDYLIVDYVEQVAPPLHRAFLVLGLFELEEFGADPATFRSAHVRRVVRFDRLPKLFSDPAGLLEEVYDWGKPSADLDALVERLFLLLAALGAPARLEYPLAEVESALAAPVPVPADAPSHLMLRLPLVHEELAGVSAEAGVSLLPVHAPQNGSPGLALTPYAEGKLSKDIPLDARQLWILGLSADVDVTLGLGVVVRPGEPLKVLTDLLGAGSSIRATFAIDLTRRAAGESMLLFGISGGSGVSAKALMIGAQLDMSTSEDPDLAIEAALEGGHVVIDAGKGDGFLQKILPKDPITADVDIAFGWSIKKGFYFLGGRLLVAIPVHVTLGPIKLDVIELGVEAEDDSIPVSVGVTAGLKLGPLAASVEGIGLILDFTFPPPGASGSVEVEPRFKPPRGAGMKIGAGPVGGGGYIYFDPDNEQYAGVLQLDFKAFSFKAIGLLTTRFPDGTKGFSLLIIITAEFNPIQLGYGFTLNGLGGLLGLNRTIVVDVLRAGIKTGAVGSILFPKDPVARAPQLLSDLRTIFPPAPNRFVVGPMVKVGWGASLITLELGVLIELPPPIRIVILGRLSLVLPDKDSPVLSLNVDILGIIEFDRGEMSLDMRLFDSRLVAFALTGEMALRLGWGAQPHFELSAGGFHPRFQPPAGFPSLERFALTLADSDNPRLRAETYFALTSNSLQLGARLDFHVHVDIAVLGLLSVDAYLGFDVLIRFSPFSLEADIGASVTLKRNGKPIFAIDLALHFTGPGPWHGWGGATLEFFGKHTLPVDFTIGDPAPPAALPESHPDQELAAALADPINWSAQLPGAGRMLVTLRDIKPGAGEVLMHPFGDLTVRQRVLPLNVTIQKFGETQPIGPLRFEVTAASVGGEDASSRAESVREHFAPARFFELSDAEKLSRPGFEALEAGRRIATEGFEEPAGVETNFDYEDILVDVDPDTGFKQRRGQPKTYRPPAAVAEALSHAGVPEPDPELGIALDEPVHVVASMSDLGQPEEPGATVAEGLTYTEALERMRDHEAGAPEDRGKLQVVGAHEAVA